MIQQVTKGIKISIHSIFNGKIFHKSQVLFHFSYEITIENQCNKTVQLLSRHWDIYDTLNELEIVEGEGVVGEKPILKPGETYTYSSNCFLKSSIGSMKGFYKMVNFSSNETFKVEIPTFQLVAPSIFN